MINSINTTNPIQMLNAQNAFKSAQKIFEPETKTEEISDGLNINDTDLFKNQDLEEIRTMAKIVGEEDLSNDDIQYGLTYGRSVIADYSV